MADPEAMSPTPPSPVHIAQPPPTMETEAQTNVPINEKKVSKKPSGISFSIWPPSQSTRDAVMTRLIETLSSESVLSKRYGSISHSEAEEAAHLIEEESFGVANASASEDDDGLKILHAYSKETSKRILETVKARATSSRDCNASEVQSPSEASTTVNGDILSAGTGA